MIEFIEGLTAPLKKVANSILIILKDGLFRKAHGTSNIPAIVWANPVKYSINRWSSPLYLYLEISWTKKLSSGKELTTMNLTELFRSTYKKTTLKWAIATLALTLAVCSSLSNPINPISNGQNQKGITTNTLQGNTAANGQQNTTANTSTAPSLSPTGLNSIIYNNTQFGFSFMLPESWKGYSIINTQWEGLALGGQTGEAIVETGPIISIRDPQWTSKTPRQDIPIMVFTLNQWNSLQQGVFHIGAAPIGPSELGRNNSYVFALPARYNYAFPPGYKEVEKIVESNPLQTTQMPILTQ